MTNIVTIKLTILQTEQVLKWLKSAGDKDQTLIGKKIKNSIPMEIKFPSTGSEFTGKTNDKIGRTKGFVFEKKSIKETFGPNLSDMGFKKNKISNKKNGGKK